MPRGGSLTAGQTRDFVRESYKKKSEVKPVGGLQFDASISTTRNKVFHDPTTGKTVIANAGTTKASDWSHNLLWGIAPSLYTKTERYKEAERIQKAAIQKYGRVDENVTHSQSGIIGREMNKRGLVNELISVNPASKGNEKQRKNEFVVRTSADPVSMLNRSNRTSIIKSNTWNPLTEHSAETLERLNPQVVFGRGFVKIHYYQ